MSLLITILIAALIFCLIWWLIGMLPNPPIPAMFVLICRIVLVVIAIIWLLGKIGIGL